MIMAGTSTALVQVMYIVKPCIDPVRTFASLVEATKYALSVGATVELVSK